MLANPGEMPVKNQSRSNRAARRQRTRAARIAAGALALALVVAACGSDDPPPADDPAPSEPDAEAPEADEPEDDAPAEGGISLAGEEITAVVGYSPGGGYDTYMRLFVPYLAEELDATIVVLNQPGAGSLIATNVLLNAPPDGLRFKILNGIGVGAASLGGSEGADFAMTDFTYLGRITAQPRVLVVAADSRYETFQDILDDWENFRAGSTGAGSSDFTDLQVIRDVFGTPFEIISGFDGSAENALALQRGDTDGMTGDIDGRLISIDAGDERPVLVIGAERDPAFPDVPTILEFDLDGEALDLAQAYVDFLELGRPFIAPAGMDPELTEFLREAFWAALNNPDMLAESEELGFPVRALDGAQTQELVTNIEANAPEVFRELMAEAAS